MRNLLVKQGLGFIAGLVVGGVLIASVAAHNAKNMEDKLALEDQGERWWIHRFLDLKDKKNEALNAMSRAYVAQYHACRHFVSDEALQAELVRQAEQ